MNLLYTNEHLACFNHDRRSRPQIEVLEIDKGQSDYLLMTQNEIVFFIEGKLKYAFDDSPKYEGSKGQILFIPSGTNSSYEAVSDCVLIIFRTDQPIRLCEIYSIEKLYDHEPYFPDFLQSTRERMFGVLEINPRLWHFLEGVHNCVLDGIKCRTYFDEVKIKELFLLLRYYYPKEELRNFFALILSGDTAFSEYIRLKWRHFDSVQEMADSMNMTYQQFFHRFVSAFNEKPQQWMNKERAKKVYSEITSTKKSFKQISMEQRFTHEGLFTRFCKRELGATPSQIRQSKRKK